MQSEPNWDSLETRALAQTACFDCHSNETDWTPWYTNIAPASWLVGHDVEEGRQYLNFSEWHQGGKPREADELWEALQYGSMPPSQYLLLHPDAQLTAQQRGQLISGFQAIVQNKVIRIGDQLPFSFATGANDAHAAKDQIQACWRAHHIKNKGIRSMSVSTITKAMIPVQVCTEVVG